MISVIIITCNNEDTIGIVLEKVAWADEVIVVDAESTDKTKEMAEKLGAKVYQREWEGYASQKKYALGMASSDWILSLDSDEVLDNDLADSIKETISKESRFDGYMIRMVTYFLNRPLRFASKPFRQMRLFRKDKATLAERSVHEHFKVKSCGAIEKGMIKHYTSPTISDRIKKINLYSTLEADEIAKSGKRIAWFDIAIWPCKSFARNYILNLGFLDGMAGFLWSVFIAAEYFLTFSKAKFKEGA